MDINKTKINCLLKVNEIFNIVSVLNVFDSKEVPGSLYNGQGGAILFLNKYGRFFNIDTSVLISNCIEGFMEQELNSFSFSSGFAGMNWLFHNLYGDSLINKKDLRSLIINETFLKRHALEQFAIGNYDFLYGGLGIAYSILYSQNFKDKRFFIDVFKVLDNIMDLNYNIFFDFDPIKKTPVAGTVNLGLAHGIPSILKFCVQCYKQNICCEEAKKKSYVIIDFLLRHYNLHQASFYSNKIRLDNISNESSRLAWCYGDLGVAYILYQSAKTFEDSKLTSFSLNILAETTHRRLQQNTKVFDAGFCHGSSGIAQIYKHVWHSTNDMIYKYAYNFWIMHTLDLATHSDGLAGYKKYRIHTDSYNNEYDLIEGIIGIGLVLLSYLDDDLSWDYCFMLND